jgi:prepilin-type N-terminal cleavage/methylation domain-containing protein
MLTSPQIPTRCQSGFTMIELITVMIVVGILAVVVVEVGLITPPVGMNVFVINGMARDVPMLESFRGVLPFLISDMIRIVVLVLFPAITLGLVRVLD